MKLSLLRGNKLIIIIVCLSMAVFVFSGILFLKHRVSSNQNVVGSGISPAPSSNTVQSTPPQTTQNVTSQTTPPPTSNPSKITTQQKPTYPSYVEDPCIKLEHNAATLDSEYFKKIIDSISVIWKNIGDRFDSNTNTFSDLDTVRAALNYANNLLDAKYADVTNAYNVQLNSSCHYKKGGVYQYHLPAISDYPMDWSETANNSIKYY